MRPDKNGRYSIAVRALCEFTAKAGDLDLRFTPAPTAREGMEGHAAIARRRGAGFESEIGLEGEFLALRVRGRADGYDPADNRLEEFKTFRGDLKRMPASHRAVHWAQLGIYGALLCRARALKEVRLALVYLDLASSQETALVETRSAAELEAFFAQHCAQFLDWAHQEMAHRSSRDAAAAALQFPFATFHGRQRELSESVYRTVCRGAALLTEAPTGIGKTVGTLFPALKATARLDKIFYLVAKTSGRQLALDALTRLCVNTPAGTIRTLELVAREKACERPGSECHGGSCPLARGFYDRLPAARSDAMSCAMLDRGAVRSVALRHEICPYYLSQELSRWADVIVADYNYYFDVSGLLHALTAMNQWKVTVLVDEAHNLIDRARSMYSSQLQREKLGSLIETAPAPLRKALRRLSGEWDAVTVAQEDDYSVHESPPEALLQAVSQCVGAIGDFSAEQPTAVDGALLEFYFDALHFVRLAARLDRDTLCETTRESPTTGSCLRLRNIVPGAFLAERWRAAQSCVLFSATLTPFEFYRDILGLPAQTRMLRVASPFTPEQLTIHVVSSISTRWRDRQRSVEPIVRLIENQFRQQPGNYLAFFSSYQYLAAVAAGLIRAAADIPVWCQEAAMSESRRESFLQRFQVNGRGVGFAVLGGVFAEGVDLPGDRLIGAFVATLGLPQLNAMNEQTQLRMDRRFGNGYDYTYLYPGLRKVIQAAGRVVRTVEDRGVVYLIDDRFAHAKVRQLLPAWWMVQSRGRYPVRVEQLHHNPATAPHKPEPTFTLSVAMTEVRID